VTFARRVRGWLRLGPTRAELIAEAELWKARAGYSDAHTREAHVRAKAAEKRARRAEIRAGGAEERIRVLLDESLNEPGKVEACSKVRFHHKPEADAWADRIAKISGEAREVFDVYGCKFCPRSPVTHRRYLHVGHGWSKQAQASRETAQHDRAMQRSTAQREGKLIEQRIDPRVMARLRDLGRREQTG
jgi:hypothetical protein